MRNLLLVAASAATLQFSASHAGIILSPVSATASSEFSGSTDAGNTIDQSGLSANFVSGVDDFDTFLAGNPVHGWVFTGIEWFSSGGVPQSIWFDLGQIYNVDKWAGWIEDFHTYEFDISSSVDGLVYTPLGSIVPIDYPADQDYPAEVFMTPFTGRYFKMDFTRCGNLCGLGEVAFSVVEAEIPVPAALPLLLTGVAGLFALRRRA